MVPACRTAAKSAEAAAALREAVPGAAVTVLDAPLELSSMSNASGYAKAMASHLKGAPLAALVNNAGIMAHPEATSGTQNLDSGP